MGIPDSGDMGGCQTLWCIRQNHMEQQAVLGAGLAPSKPDTGHLHLCDAKLHCCQKQAIPQQPPRIARHVPMVRKG